MVIAKSTGDVDPEPTDDNNIPSNVAKGTTTTELYDNIRPGTRYESPLQQMGRVSLEEHNILKAAMDNTYEAYSLADEYSQRISALENETMQLRRAMSQLQKEKGELQGILACQRLLESSARQTIPTGKSGLSDIPDISMPIINARRYARRFFASASDFSCR